LVREYIIKEILYVGFVRQCDVGELSRNPNMWGRR